MYIQATHKRLSISDLKSTIECPGCGSAKLRLDGGKLICRQCHTIIGKLGRSNKYGAKRTELNGKMYDSKFEAEVAAELELEKRSGNIKDFDTQYQISGWVYDENGNKAFPYKHRVDFRVHNLDGTYTLKEAKGVETDDYKWRRKILEKVWLPAHPEYRYEVVFKKDKQRRVKK